MNHDMGFSSFKEKTENLPENPPLQTELIPFPASRNDQSLSSLSISNSTVQLVSKDESIKTLLNDHDLLKILVKNPWTVNIKNALYQIQSHMYENVYIKFRIGGKIVYSASQIIRSKSVFIIQESQSTQKELEINEIEDENIDIEESPKESASNQVNEQEFIEDPTLFQNKNSLKEDALLPKDPLYLDENENPVSLLSSIDPSANSFFHMDKDGNRYLQTPMKHLFRKITFDDLGRALVKTLNYHIIKRKRSIENAYSDESDVLLPDQLLKNAEDERTLVETQIMRMYDRIVSLYHNEEPIQFLQLVLAPTPDGIVDTVLYLLQLVNRKKIDLWQKIYEDTVPEIKISKKKKNQEKVEDITLKEKSPLPELESAGLDIFITPRNTG